MIEKHRETAHAPYDPGIQPGVAIRLSDRTWRVTARNPGLMTGPGTNSYLVGGADGCAAIDPGPEDARHLEALLGAAPGVIRYILVTHTHPDHCAGAVALKSATGAALLGRATPHRQPRDIPFDPARELRHGDRLDLSSGATLRVIHTPGHASNHLCFLLEAERLLFTGDHIIQGSTVVIDPPDGDMVAYLVSLKSLLHEALDSLAPGHGTLMLHPHAAILDLIQHRLHREATVLDALPHGIATGVDRLLPRVYADVPSQRHDWAARSLLAHLIKLEGEGRARRVGGNWMAVDP